jgi:hypothetical protein
VVNRHLQVERPLDLVSGVTADADFIGDSVLAKELAMRLGWQLWIPAPDDSTPQTGKVTHRTKSGAVKEVHSLSGVAGLTTKDLARRGCRREKAITEKTLERLKALGPMRATNARRCADLRPPAAASG